VLVVGAGPKALAETDIPSGSLWIHGALGATFSSATTLTHNADEADLSTGGAVHPSFGIGFHYRTARFDVGVLAGGMGSGSVQGLETDRYAGSKARVCASVRWRYVDEPWGGFFLRLAPGVALLEHSDALRSEVAVQLDLQRDQIANIDSFNVAFTLGASLGLVVHIERWLLGYLEFEVVTTLTDMQDGSEMVGYTAIQPIFALGFEARL